MLDLIRRKLTKEAEAKETPKPALPIAKPKEDEITKRLDQKAKEDSPAPGLAVQERARTVTKQSEDGDIYTKTAEAVCRQRVRRRLAGFNDRLGNKGK
jgi:hypothetical protein